MVATNIAILVKQIRKYRKEGLLPMVKEKDLKEMSSDTATLLVYHAELGEIKPATTTEKNRIEIMIRKGFLLASYRKKLQNINSQEAKAIIREGDLNARTNQIAKEGDKND